MVETRPTLPKNFVSSSPCASETWIKVDFRNALSLPANFTVLPSSKGNANSLSFGMRTSFALSLRAWISDASIFSSSSTSATRYVLSKCLPHTHVQWGCLVGLFETNLMESVLVFRWNRVKFHQRSWRNHCTTKWISKSPFKKSFPVR